MTGHYTLKGKSKETRRASLLFSFNHDKRERTKLKREVTGQLWATSDQTIPPHHLIQQRIKPYFQPFGVWWGGLFEASFPPSPLGKQRFVGGGDRRRQFYPPDSSLLTVEFDFVSLKNIIALLRSIRAQV